MILRRSTTEHILGNDESAKLAEAIINLCHEDVFNLAVSLIDQIKNSWITEVFEEGGRVYPSDHRTLREWREELSRLELEFHLIDEVDCTSDNLSESDTL